ncbi:MAG: hypothetical protein GX113_04240 [Actinobacteria bacterium]|jgi:hypothetical protein|nr:hypothetical protein [Actinomycetota bacterium]
MPRFIHEAGPGTVVVIGNRRFPMPYETDDPKTVRLLRKMPGVQEQKAKPVRSEPESAKEAKPTKEVTPA